MARHSFFHPALIHRLNHGGELRKARAGRKFRPLSAKDPIHLVLKANKFVIPGGLRSPKRFRVIIRTMQKYAWRFFVKIEQFSVQNDHIHLAIRGSRRSNVIYFLRVLAGQIAQIFENEGLLKKLVTDTPAGSLLRKVRLWKLRPFTRVVKGRHAYRTLRDYIQLNELEGKGIIRYQKLRLRGLTPLQRKNLWLQ